MKDGGRERCYPPSNMIYFRNKSVEIELIFNTFSLHSLAASPNSLGSQATLQSRNEHLYMTLPAVRSESKYFSDLFKYVKISNKTFNICS